MAFSDNGKVPAESLAEQFDRRAVTDPVLRVLFEVMYDQESRLRVLEGRPAITRAQARAALKNLYTGG